MVNKQVKSGKTNWTPTRGKHRLSMSIYSSISVIPDLIFYKHNILSLPAS